MSESEAPQGSDHSTHAEDHGRSHSLWWFAALLALVVLSWAASWFLVERGLAAWTERASFGDMFGAVNALFSGAALAGVIFTLLLQRRELELQRLELRLTRHELQRTAVAQERAERAAAANLLPLLFVSIAREERDMLQWSSIDVQNVGTTPAFDVQVAVIWTMPVEALPRILGSDAIASLANEIGREHVSPTYFSNIVFVPLVPARRAVRCALGPISVTTDAVTVMMQVRNAGATNYLQFSIHDLSTWDGSTERLALTPPVPMQWERELPTFTPTFTMFDDGGGRVTTRSKWEFGTFRELTQELQEELGWPLLVFEQQWKDSVDGGLFNARGELQWRDL